MRSTPLPMDTFGKQAIEQYAMTNGVSPSAVVRDAAVYYASDRERCRQAWRVPRFAREAEGGEKLGGGEELHVELDDSTWAAIEREAQRQGLRPVLLLRHALLYFLADVMGSSLRARRTTCQPKNTGRT